MLHNAKLFISIIILNYNGRRFLERCLTSIKNLTYPKYEVIVVDNASTDNSVEFIKEFFPWVTLIENPTNLGFTEGNNIGILNAKGQMVALLNNDTEVDSNWLSELVKVAQADPMIGACSGKFLDFYSRKTLQNPGFGEEDRGQYDDVKEIETAYGAGMLVNREVIRTVGLLDPKYFIYFEEIDWCWRMRLAGYKIVYVPKAIVYHVGGGAETPQSIYLNYRNWLRTLLKNCEAQTLVLYIPVIIGKFGYAFLLSARLGKKNRKVGLERIKAYFKGLLWNMFNLRSTMRERVRVQKLRKVPDRCLHIHSFRTNLSRLHEHKF